MINATIYNNIFNFYIEVYNIHNDHFIETIPYTFIKRSFFRDILIDLWITKFDMTYYIRFLYKWYAGPDYYFEWLKGENTFYSIVNNYEINDEEVVIHMLMGAIVKDKEKLFSTRYGLK